MEEPIPGLPHGVYGAPHPALATVGTMARQYSPVVPGALALEAADEASLGVMTIAAPPATIERRFAIAAMLKALAPGAPFKVLAAKDMGGSRLGKELATFGCAVDETAKRHHRICTGRRPAASGAIDADEVERALADGAPRWVEDLGLWSQPGIFSWDRIDPGTALLLRTLPPLSGRGADFGCGIGLLGHRVLASAKVERLDLLDVDRRAIEAARHNLDDPRAAFHWIDIARGTGLEALDFVVMNPPFHDVGTEDRTLGQTFIRRAAEALRKGGRLWLTANRHLPYEVVLKPLFRQVNLVTDTDGYKVIEATK